MARESNVGGHSVGAGVGAACDDERHRGAARPDLQHPDTAVIAGLVTGVLWGSLHLALTMPGMIFDGMPLLPVVLEVLGLSVLGTWLYIRSSGNVLLTSLFHAAQSFFVIVND